MQKKLNFKEKIMNNEIKIRKVKAEDAEQWSKLQNLVWRYAYKDLLPESVFVEREKPERIAKIITGFAKHQLAEDRICYVAEVNTRLIGYVSGIVKSEYEHFGIKNYADLQAIYIHPNYQHCGLGKKFFNLFVDELKKRNLKRFVVGVLKDNLQARRAYEKWGGKLDVYTQPFIKDGVELTEVFYTYDIEKIKNKEDL